ncbi:dynein heavy chain 9, axonemal-like, partial [Neopelma chrysocephalum]|uniref:dynein heavy chain 9, axonemal-like n=1 Tax=Neopelma chrysocephalum TaxID=114329 RepID=UPI000FCD1C37
GLLFSTPECLKEPQDLVKLYLHESNRVYRDKMVEANDYGTFDKIQRETVKKFYDDIEETLEQTKHMNIFCHFAKGTGEPGYRPIPTWEELNQILVEALDNYNEVNAAMNLVLFEDAMCHV